MDVQTLTHDINQLIKAVEIAQGKGAYSLEDAGKIFLVIRDIKKILTPSDSSKNISFEKDMNTID